MLSTGCSSSAIFYSSIIILFIISKASQKNIFDCTGCPKKCGDILMIQSIKQNDTIYLCPLGYLLVSYCISKLSVKLCHKVFQKNNNTKNLFCQLF